MRTRNQFLGLSALIASMMSLAGAAESPRCPAPVADPEPYATLMLAPLDTPEFRAGLRAGHAWRERAGFVGEYHSRLELAAYLGEIELMAKLLDAIAPPGELVRAAVAALVADRLPPLELLLRRHLPPTASTENDVPLLAVASSLGRVDAMEALVRAGADVNARDGLGGDAVAAAVTTHQRDALRWLIEHGADVKSSRTRRSTNNPQGMPVVELARRLGDACAIEMLKAAAHMAPTKRR